MLLKLSPLPINIKYIRHNAIQFNNPTNCSLLHRRCLYNSYVKTSMTIGFIAALWCHTTSIFSSQTVYWACVVPVHLTGTAHSLISIAGPRTHHVHRPCSESTDLLPALFSIAEKWNRTAWHLHCSAYSTDLYSVWALCAWQDLHNTGSTGQMQVEFRGTVMQYGLKNSKIHSPASTYSAINCEWLNIEKKTHSQEDDTRKNTSILCILNWPPLHWLAKSYHGFV